jgi:phosphoserine phosphatase
VSPRGLVVFDLDGTLLRGPTVCEILAAPLGRIEEMRAFESLTGQPEIAEARIEMAQWYNGTPRERLLEFLRAAQWAPGAIEGVAALREAGIEVAIASITWDFAVRWFADQLGVKHFLGTGLADIGQIEHVWPEHKADWLTNLAGHLGVPDQRTAAVGDSSGDAAMLNTAALRFYVGPCPPSELDCFHMPDANILALANIILTRWCAAAG